MQVHVNRKRLRRILPDAAASIGAARRESRGEGPGPDSLLPQGPKRKNGRRRKWRGGLKSRGGGDGLFILRGGMVECRGGVGPSNLRSTGRRPPSGRFQTNSKFQSITWSCDILPPSLCCADTHSTAPHLPFHRSSPKQNIYKHFSCKII